MQLQQTKAQTKAQTEAQTDTQKFKITDHLPLDEINEQRPAIVESIRVPPKVMSIDRPDVQHVTELMANVQVPSQADFMKGVMEEADLSRRSKDVTKEFNNHFNRQVKKPLEQFQDDIGDDCEDDKQKQKPLEPTSLTAAQRDLICDVFDEKARIYTHELKSQFNNMHLELIRNFQQQQSDLRGQLNEIAGKNYSRKLQLKKLRVENSELKQINF